MLEWYQTLILGLLQGLTEFLPISSSAHLVLPSLVLGWQDQGLAFDVAVHVGTLAAVLFYYRRDIYLIGHDWLGSLFHAQNTPESRMGWYLICASIPVAIVGATAGDYIASDLRTLPVLATTTLLFGLLLGYADRRGAAVSSYRALSLPLALLIGLAQALAPIPGVSRSGITISAGLLLGLGRQAAARFSFLLSVPAISGAGGVKMWQLAQGSIEVDWPIVFLGAVVSGVTALACIALFLRILDRMGLMPFVYYRVLLALILFGLWLT